MSLHETKRVIKELLSTPKIIGVVGDTNTGKTQLLHHIINTVVKDYDTAIYTYNIQHPATTQLYSLLEVENVRNGIIIVDEFINLFDTTDRKKKKQIENSLRLIHHHNNVIVLSGLPENFNKFISAKVNAYLLKTITLDDCINGSKLKKIINQYQGVEKGTTALIVDKSVCIGYFNNRFFILKHGYYSSGDTKRFNQPILKKRS